MNVQSASPSLEQSRTRIARAAQALRKERGWTQVALARRLELSQSRLSEIERGDGSFTAEQFLELLKLFNASLSDFVPQTVGKDQELQNALARLGAVHLHESSDVLPTEQLNQVTDVVREAIVASEFPRITTALAPVLVRNIDRINLRKLRLELGGAGLERRLAWVLDNTLEALGQAGVGAPPAVRRTYRRARVVLEAFLSSLNDGASGSEALPADVLDPTIRSKKTLEEVAATASAISRRWNVVSALQPEDFAHALREAHATPR